MDYYYVLKVKTLLAFEEIIKAELAQIGFDSFLDSETYFETSIPAQDYDQQALEQLISHYQTVTQIDYSMEKVKRQNWNKLWEAYYEPIRIADRCLIRADFHEIDQKFDYELIINPKMSFGTGHHQTTSQMIEYQLETNFEGKKVADFGCGTGVLSIMAKKRGAQYVKSCDIDDWAVENSKENATVNQVEIEVVKGTVKAFDQKDKFQIILANINLNVLLHETSQYVNLLQKDGLLFMSGFYRKDLPRIREQAEKYQLCYLNHKVKKDWVAVQFIKI